MLGRATLAMLVCANFDAAYIDLKTWNKCRDEWRSLLTICLEGDSLDEHAVDPLTDDIGSLTTDYDASTVDVGALTGDDAASTDDTGASTDDIGPSTGGIGTLTNDRAASTSDNGALASGVGASTGDIGPSTGSIQVAKLVLRTASESTSYGDASTGDIMLVLLPLMTVLTGCFD
jgi:hypothetical protein